MQLGADQRDVGNLGGGGRDHQGIVVHLVDQDADAVTQGAEHGDRGHHEQQDAQQCQQGGGPALLSAQTCGETLVEGVEGYGQDQGPQHHVHEGGEDGDAEGAQR